MSHLKLNTVTAPVTPAANKVLIYVDSVDGRLKMKNSAGVVVTLARVEGANIFTADQQITGTLPEIALLHSGTGKGRLMATSEGDIRISRNVDYDGTNWNLDNTSLVGVQLALNASGNLVLQSMSAGSNPRTPVTHLTVAAATGNALLGGTLDVTGLATLLNGQLKFPAAQNASADVNTLDDYEEGTYATGDASGAGVAISGSGSYVKVGRMVVVQMQVQYPATASSNPAQFYGVPFTCTGNSALAPGYIAVTGFASGRIHFWLQSGSSVVVPMADGAQLTNAQMASCNIVLGGAYIATA